MPKDRPYYDAVTQVVVYAERRVRLIGDVGALFTVIAARYPDHLRFLDLYLDMYGDERVFWPKSPYDYIKSRIFTLRKALIGIPLWVESVEEVGYRLIIGDIALRSQEIYAEEDALEYRSPGAGRAEIIS